MELETSSLISFRELISPLWLFIASILFSLMATFTINGEVLPVGKNNRLKTGAICWQFFMRLREAKKKGLNMFDLYVWMSVPKFLNY